MSTATLATPSSTRPAATPADSDPWPDIRRLAVDLDEPEYLAWLLAVFPGYVSSPLAAHHHDLWAWLWAIEADERPEPFVGIWPRGGAKSTSAELGAVALGARRRRCYGLYVCGTQDQADDHVGNIGALLESRSVAVFHPELADRLVGKYGNSKGWRRNRLRTSSGFTVDAIGLDTAARGVKLEDQRPDFLVIDDVDSQHDSTAVSRRKVETITRALIPAGAPNLAILAIQNLVIADGVFTQLASGRAEFLARRHVSGPLPAIHGLQTERRDGRDVIVAGEPSWVGQGLAACQQMIDDMGLHAFLLECQHDVDEVEGALWCRDQLAGCRVADHPELDRLVVGVDPSGGAGGGHDLQGIVAVGRGVDGHGYVLADETCSLSPMGWGKRAVRLAVELGADRIVGETNYGGAMVASTIRLAADALVVEGLADAARFGTQHPAGVGEVSASKGKRVRAEPIAALYGERERSETWPDAMMHHVGLLPELELEQCTWDPEIGSKSPNRVDALVWASTELKLQGRRGRRARFTLEAS